MRLKFTNILLLLFSLLGCSSCLYEKLGVCPGDELLPPNKEQFVNLDLSISINDGLPSSSRAANVADYGDFDGYEGPLNIYEKVRTLRVVIVKQDGTIEHNRMVTVKEGYKDFIQSQNIINDNLQFRITANETKRIYLFANESAVNDNKEESEKFDFSSELTVGQPFPTTDVEAILIKRNSEEAFIDNDTNPDKLTYVPMSEFFEVDIPEFNEIPDIDGNLDNPNAIDKFFSQTLFITRSLIKFSFTVKLKDEGIETTNLALKGVKISNLANEGYYLPKSTRYNPEWPDVSTNELGGREIVDFKVPYEDPTPSDLTGLFSDCTFLFQNDLPISSNRKESGPIMIYLPESKTVGDNKYMVKLLFTNDEDYYETLPLSIKDIPRNTHVKINMLLSSSQLEATVQIVPYISVVLDPIFGFDEINPGKQHTEPEN